MTITRIVALLSVLALLASLPLSVALGQGLPPFTVVGTAMVDGEKAMMDSTVVAMAGDEEIGMAMVEEGGMFTLFVEEGAERDAMISFMLKMGEGDGIHGHAQHGGHGRISGRRSGPHHA